MGERDRREATDVTSHPKMAYAAHVIRAFECEREGETLILILMMKL